MNKDEIKSSPSFQSLISAMKEFAKAAESANFSFSKFAAAIEVAHSNEIPDSEFILEDILDADYVEE